MCTIKTNISAVKTMKYEEACRYAIAIKTNIPAVKTMKHEEACRYAYDKD